MTMNLENTIVDTVATRASQALTVGNAIGTAVVAEVAVEDEVWQRLLLQLA